MNITDVFLHQLLNIGEQMLTCGAEVNRVENTLNRMGYAHGALNMNVFVITSSIVITMKASDGTEHTQTRRITTSGNTDFTKLEQLNNLSRKYCLGLLSVSDISRELSDICARTPGKFRYYTGSMLAAGSFAVFFGGTILDGTAGALAAILICFLQDTIPGICRNKIIFNFITAFITGVFICFLTAFFPFLQNGKIMIGTIMLLIPGIAMTNSIRDILMGDTISGIMRLIETLFWAGALACGFMSAIWITGG